MRAKVDNIEIMIGSETDEVIEKLFGFLLRRYQEGLEESVRGSKFIFKAVNTLYYDLNKISLSRDKSYIDSPEWLKNKKATISPKNNDDKSFQYALTVALNYKQIKRDPQRISRIKPFIYQYNWKEINFPSEKKDWKKSKSHIKSVAIDILYVPYNTKEIKYAYISQNIIYSVKIK